MLRNQTLLTALRQTPFRVGTSHTASPLRAITRTFRLPRHHRIQHRTLLSKSPSRPTLLTTLPRWRPSFHRVTRNIRQNSNKPVPTPATENGSAPLSMSARFRDLSRRYGYAAVGVYLGLSVIDFPFCFLAVRLVGPERVGEVEHAIVDAFWSIISVVVPSMGPEDRTVDASLAEAEARETQALEMNGHKHNETASIWTQLLLAYGIHKSLIFFRVPLTAAVTPKVVKTLRAWGWNIGRPAKRVKSPSA